MDSYTYLRSMGDDVWGIYRGRVLTTVVSGRAEAEAQARARPDYTERKIITDEERARDLSIRAVNGIGVNARR
jgi:hypothetical protein